MLDYNSIVMCQVYQKRKMFWIWMSIALIFGCTALIFVNYLEELKTAFAIAIISGSISFLALVTTILYGKLIKKIKEDLITS